MATWLKNHFVAVNISLTGLSLALTALVATNQWNTASTLGRQGQQLETILAALPRLATIETLITETRREIAVLNVDPAEILQRAGVPIDRDLELVAVNGNVIALPSTEEARQRLEQANYVPVAVTPSIQGYALDAAAAEAFTQALAERSAASLSGETNAIGETIGIGMPAAATDTGG